MKKVLLLTAAMLLPMSAKAETIQDVLQQMRGNLGRGSRNLRQCGGVKGLPDSRKWCLLVGFRSFK